VGGSGGHTTDETSGSKQFQLGTSAPVRWAPALPRTPCTSHCGRQPPVAHKAAAPSCRSETKFMLQPRWRQRREVTAGRCLSGRLSRVFFGDEGVGGEARTSSGSDRPRLLLGRRNDDSLSEDKARHRGGAFGRRNLLAALSAVGLLHARGGEPVMSPGGGAEDAKPPRCATAAAGSPQRADAAGGGRCEHIRTSA
jgi:hypothetical protein